jgi:isopentenyl-diphosphate delta-isomerase
MASHREAHLVELVDPNGRAIGVATVEAAHQSPGPLHRAFSVVILDDDDRVLLQQRSAEKTRFALRWANACCGHPAPGVAVEDSATIRLGEELGASPIPLKDVGVHLYQASDDATGRVEHEWDHVLLARVPVDGVALAPDPSEVAATRWAPLAEVYEQAQAEPAGYAPWLVGALRLVLEASRER